MTGTRCHHGDSLQNKHMKEVLFARDEGPRDTYLGPPMSIWNQELDAAPSTKLDAFSCSHSKASRTWISNNYKDKKAQMMDV